MEITRAGKRLTARDAGLVACRRCARVWPMGQARCGRCGSHLESRDTKSLQKVWAWWIAGVIAYIPANLYPMLKTNTLVSHTENTIIGGAVELAHHGSFGVAAIILIASVLIPVGKFLAIAFLAISARRGSTVPPHPHPYVRDRRIHRPLVHDRRLCRGNPVVACAVVCRGLDPAGTSGHDLCFVRHLHHVIRSGL